jgi:hypothetical protein
MVRLVVVVLFAITACTPAQAPKARKVGMVMSVGGVLGLIGSAAAANQTRYANDMMISFSAISFVGMLVFAAGELTTPEAVDAETIPERNHRWARILTERAAGAAREGRCPRVRRLEIKVRGYDREVHDFVFMRDPEILKCMSPPESPAPALAP